MLLTNVKHGKLTWKNDIECHNKFREPKFSSIWSHSYHMYLTQDIKLTTGSCDVRYATGTNYYEDEE